MTRQFRMISSPLYYLEFANNARRFEEVFPSQQKFLPRKVFQTSIVMIRLQTVDLATYR